MKILLINNDKGWSGGQEHLIDLTGELMKRGDSIQFVVREGSKAAARFSALGVPVTSLPAHSLTGDVRGLFLLVALLRREKFDIVSINREHDLLLTSLAWKIAFPFGSAGRLMMSYHTATARRQPFLGLADGILCISEHVRSMLLKANSTAEGQIRVLHYGIRLNLPPSPERFNDGRTRHFFPERGFPLITMVGEFWKNQQELIDAVAILKVNWPEITVALVGDNTDPVLAGPVIERIKVNGLTDNVLFTGRIPRERIPDIFFDSDLAVSTHRNEGFGIVHLEALAAGTPVVCYDSGGMVDILKGEDVGMTVSGGPAEFASTLDLLLCSPEERRRLGKNGWELVNSRYSVQAMADRYQAYYRSLLEGGEA
jgi:glycosyltransferase involved in cell wall biosynthesis